MAEISRSEFLRLAKGSRLIKIYNFDSAALYESTAYLYRCKDDSVIYKIATRSLRSDGRITYNYYKERKNAASI